MKYKPKRLVTDGLRSYGVARRAVLPDVRHRASRYLVSDDHRMTPASACYPRHRFPAEIISYAVWLYHLFSLSLGDVELLLAERGVISWLPLPTDGFSLVRPRSERQRQLTWQCSPEPRPLKQAAAPLTLAFKLLNDSGKSSPGRP